MSLLFQDVHEGTLASLSMANTALAGHALCLAKNYYIVSLKLATEVYSLIWPLPPTESDHQGPAIKVLKSSNLKPRLAHPIKIKHFALTQCFPLLPL